MAPLEGDARLGDYELQDELGRGGMGRVVRALHRPTGALRAVKLISGRIDVEGMIRLRREGEALARVGGEAVVPVHEAGVDNGRAFLALGLMTGGSLRDRLRGGPLPWREACAIGAHLARALERCHAAGLVHRDLKPDNVLFDGPPPGGRPRLADFGCVRDLSGERLTATGEVLGTLAYMAPEQLHGAAVTGAADVYALGVIVHELVLGRRAEGPSSTFEAMREKLRPKRPREPLPAAAPAALDRLLDRVLAPAPADRPAAGELARELEAIGRGEARSGSARSLAAALAVALAGVALAGAAVGLVESDPPPVAPAAQPPSAPTPVAAVEVSRPATTVADALASLRARGRAREAPPLVDELLARRSADGALSPADVATLRSVALERVREACDEGTEAACADALPALAVAARCGDGALAVDPAALARVIGAVTVACVKDGRPATVELLRGAARAVALVPEPDVSRATVQLAETVDLARGAERASLDEAVTTLEAAIRAQEAEPRGRYVLGLLLLHRALEEDRADLVAPARSAIEAALQSRLPRLNRNDLALAIAASIRLALLAGQPDMAAARIDEPRPDDVVAVIAETPRLRAILEIERARVFLATGRAGQAAARLFDASMSLSVSHAAVAELVTDLSVRARNAADQDELRALARELPQLY